ncbi:MAG: hypothetical protein ACRECR_04680, partial [Thermoplasmata archaeon]
MSGLLRPDGTLLVTDASEAGTVYARGFFGRPLPGGGLELDRSESVYLSEMGRLGVSAASGRPAPWGEVLRRAVRAEPGFPVAYLVYRD